MLTKMCHLNPAPCHGTPISIFLWDQCVPLTTRAAPTTSSSLIDQTLRSDCDQSVLTSQSWPAEVAMVDQMGRETMSGQFSTLITWNKYRPGFSQGLPPTSTTIPPRQANISIPMEGVEMNNFPCQVSVGAHHSLRSLSWGETRLMLARLRPPE